MEELLQKLILSFEDTPATSGRRMRELLEKDPWAFLPAALATLRQAATSGQLLHELLEEEDPPAFLPAAQATLRHAAHLRAYRCLIALLAGNDLLRRCGGPRLLPALAHLLQHPDPQIRSKVALLIGRRHESSRPVEHRREEADPRLRANAIEGLWGVDGEGVRRALWGTSRDAGSRTAGNALLGLHRLGETGVIDRILKMALHAQARFRATAAWVMGESADPRFLEPLGRMLADPERAVRTRAFRSLALIRRLTGALAQNGHLQVHLWEASSLPDGARRLRVATVDTTAATPLPVLAATQFIVTEASQLVRTYEVRSRPAPALLSVGFALPRASEGKSGGIERTLLDCLCHERPACQWAIAPYSVERAEPGERESSMETPRFSANAKTLAAWIERRVAGPESAHGLLDAARLLLESAASLSGERHLVLVSSLPDARGATEELDLIGAKARYHGVAIHGLAVAGGVSPMLQTLCQVTGGRLFDVRDEAEIHAALRRIFWGLQYQDEIHYRLDSAGAGPALARVQVCCELGMAEDCLPLE